jgi:trehalose/maltose hydrolase-like predicted phosphorylase
MKQVSTEYVVTQNKAFRLKVRQWKAASPKDLNSIEFVQECLDKDGEVDFTSTYQYNMTNDDLKKLSIIINKLAESV